MASKKKGKKKAERKPPVEKSDALKRKPKPKLADLIQQVKPAAPAKAATSAEAAGINMKALDTAASDAPELDPELNPMQREFVSQLLIHNFNATAAYLATFKGTKKSAAAANASRLLAQELVQVEVRRQIQHRLMRLELSQDLVLQEWQTLSMANIVECFDVAAGGIIILKDLTRLPPAMQRNIKKVKIHDRYDDQGNFVGQTTELELHDRTAILRDAARHFGMFVEKKEIDIGPNMAELLQKRERQVERLRRGLTLEHEKG